MKFWQAVSHTETEHLLEVAVAAEEAGFDGILVSDHLFYPGKLDSKYPYSPDGTPAFMPETPWPEPWSTIAAMAAVTKHIKFATMVYILPLRNPLEVAKATATVAVLSNNRLAVGIGTGWMKEEFDALGVDFHTRGKRTNEAIEVLRTVWGGGMVEHHGEFFDFGPLQMSPAPSVPIPIYVGGMSKVAMRRAAKLCDGWMGAGSDPADVPAILDQLRTYRKDAGRDGEPFETVVPLTVPPTPDLLKEMEQLGVQGTVSYPFFYTLGPTSSLDQKREYLRQMGGLIAAVNGA